MEQAGIQCRIDYIYNILIGHSDDSPIIENPWDIDDLLTGLDSYNNDMDEKHKKNTGSFYTDAGIVKYITNIALGEIDIVQNPYLRILDPSCGCGYFLIEAYKSLKNKYMENMHDINKRFPGINLCPENIHDHIIQNNIFGADIDPYAVKLSIINLMAQNRVSRKIPNIICCDSLIDHEGTLFENDGFWNMKFDLIIGNPPYIGHKKVSGEYRKILSNIYGDIFKDKADISFCFIKSSIDRLTPNGSLCFITSRYFMESPSGMALRHYITGCCSIKQIIDFYGVRIMKGISVDPVIIFIQKGKDSDSQNIGVLKAKAGLKNLKGGSISLSTLSDDSYFKSFVQPQSSLKDSGWSLWSSSERSIIEKIENRLKFRLSDVCESFQGIITGCDRAFIVDSAAIEKYGIEKQLLKRWIKGSCIKKYRVDISSLYIIYSDMIDDISNFDGAISYIQNYRDRLEKRRECIKGIRQWYQLQWGRKSSLFDMTKIIFPYKSATNRFAVDTGSYSSADVYGMYIKDKYKEKLSNEFLCGILNSRLYEFYFKSFAKKLGEDLYDYYPNTVMRLMVPCIDDTYIKEKAEYIIKLGEQGKASDIMDDIDRYLYDIFELTSSEIEMVEKGLKL